MSKSKELEVWVITPDQIKEKEGELVEEGFHAYICDPVDEKVKHGEGYKHIIHTIEEKDEKGKVIKKTDYRLETPEGCVVLQKK